VTASPSLSWEGVAVATCGGKPMELDLKDYIKIIKKRVWMIVSIVMISGLAAGLISYLYIQPVYEASTKLIVNKSNMQAGIGLEQMNLNDINFNIRLIDTYKEIIRTPAIMDKVAIEYEALNLTPEQLIQKVRVNSVNNTQVMTLIVQDTSYERAMNIVNAVSKVFQREIPLIMSVDNVSLLNEAKPMDNPTPVKPNPILNIAISLVLALMAAVGLTFLLVYLDDSIKTEEDIQTYLGLPTLAVIAKFKEEDLEMHQTAVSKRKAGETKHATTINV
jgi:capsular polysaccharide biosynthesis protein